MFQRLGYLEGFMLPVEGGVLRVQCAYSAREKFLNELKRNCPAHFVAQTFQCLEDFWILFVPVADRMLIEVQCRFTNHRRVVKEQIWFDHPDEIKLPRPNKRSVRITPFFIHLHLRENDFFRVVIMVAQADDFLKQYVTSDMELMVEPGE